ncbi:MAG: hypothetical protein GY699_08405 [Desulfobacteraceae bacterium]|nr:hypothetical protein [Desulfobacteraceae bacterium]
MKKILLSLASMILFLGVTSFSYSFTFFDYFDDNGRYNDWTYFSGDWGYVQFPPPDNYVLAGFNNTGIEDNVAGIQYSGHQFPTQNISITTRFKIQVGESAAMGGGIGFAVNGSGINITDYTGFWVGVNKWGNNPDYVLAMGPIGSVGPPLHEILLTSLPASFPLDTVLQLSVQTGSDDNIDVTLEEWIDPETINPIFSGTFNIGLTSGPSSGGVGLFTNHSAEFRYYSVTDHTPVPALVTGEVQYSGNKTDEIFIAAINTADFSVSAQTSISAPGPYALTVQPGNYYIIAQMDTDKSGEPDFQTFQKSEPSGHYDAGCGNGGEDDPIDVDGAPVREMNIYLTDFMQSNIRHNIFPADFISGQGNDMGYHDDFLWICDHTWPGNGTFDIHKVNPVNGNLHGSFDLGIFNVTSIEWIGNDLWVCFKDWGQLPPSWKIRKYTFDGTTFTSAVTYDLPSSGDGDSVWSINIAYDGNLLWAQEKGHGARIYKVDLADGSIVDTIFCNDFEYNKKVGLADIADIDFSDGFLWAMDDGYPIFVQIDPVSSHSTNYTFNQDIYPFEDGAKFQGIVKNGGLFYFLQKVETKDGSGNVIDETYQIQSASIDQCLSKTITLPVFAANFGKEACNNSGLCDGDGDFDFDIDGKDLQDILDCQE